MSTVLEKLDKLNRLRVNAGMSELKSWKASVGKLIEKIEQLEGQGYTDALPGANIKASPQVTEELQQDLKKNEEIVKQTLGESALAKNIDNTKPEEPKKDKPRARLARGLDTDPYARQSRLAVQMAAEKERKEKKAADKLEKKKDKKKKKIKLSKADKKQIKDEARDRKINPVGAVDPKKDPEKAKRQIEKIKAKQKAREEKKDKPKDDKNFTVADLARDLDIDPKTARNKLRRHEDKIKRLHSKGQDRWTFPNDAKKEISKILRGEK